MSRLGKETTAMNAVREHYGNIVGVDTHALTTTYSILVAATGEVVDTATFPTSGRRCPWCLSVPVAAPPDHEVTGEVNHAGTDGPATPILPQGVRFWGDSKGNWEPEASCRSSGNHANASSVQFRWHLAWLEAGELSLWLWRLPAFLGADVVRIEPGQPGQDVEQRSLAGSMGRETAPKIEREVARVRCSSSAWRTDRGAGR